MMDERLLYAVELLEGFDGFYYHEAFESADDNLRECIENFKELARVGFELECASLSDNYSAYVFGVKVETESLEYFHDALEEISDVAWEEATGNLQDALYTLRDIVTDCSVQSELITEPLKIKEIEPALNFWLWFLYKCDLECSPEHGAGCHMTVSLEDRRLPAFVKANVEQLTVRFAIPLALLSWRECHSERDRGYFDLNSIYANYNTMGIMLWENEAEGIMRLSMNDKYKFVHDKEFPTNTAFEFRYPDASMNAKHLWRVAIINMAIVLKALKISYYWGGIIQWNLAKTVGVYDVIDELNSFSDIGEAIKKYNRHIKEFLDFIRPEIEEITDGHYDEWFEDAFDVYARDEYDFMPAYFEIYPDLKLDLADYIDRDYEDEYDDDYKYNEDLYL